VIGERIFLAQAVLYSRGEPFRKAGGYATSPQRGDVA